LQNNYQTIGHITGLKKRNGKDPKKWLESLEELYNDGNSFTMDICYRNIYSVENAGIHRTNEHLNMMLKQKIKEGRLYDAAVAFDYLKRGNKKTTNPEEMKKYTINQQSWDLISTILLDNKEYEFLALVARATEKDKNIKISDDIRKKNKRSRRKG